MSATGVRVNLTSSIPVGIYRAVRGEPVRGSLVIACLPESVIELAQLRQYVPRGGACRGGLVPIGKPVVAVEGDTVTLSTSGALVNGQKIVNTKPLRFDRQDRALPALPLGRYIVSPGEVWLLSSHSPFSFDSRYFGPVPTSHIKARLEVVVAMPGSGGDDPGH